MMLGLSQPGSKPGATYNFAVKVQGTTARFNWYPSQGAAGYVVGLYHIDVNTGNPLPTAYLTKATNLTVTGLPPIPAYVGVAYYAFLWCFNSSGVYEVPNPINFNTK